MKKILFILTIALLLIACKDKQDSSAKSPKDKIDNCDARQSEQVPSALAQKNRVEVLYFHGKQSCITCNTIQKLTKELLENSFAEEIKNGKIIFKVIDISKKENEQIADQYEVTWSSLFLNKWEDGQESKNNMTDFGFSYAKGSPEIFKNGIKEKLDTLLN